MPTFYNEHEPFAVAWLRGLIEAGEISGGHVDQRDIQTVQPDDVRGYERAHFFAGIAGWDLALRLAGWPADRPVWTGSCPCQPFSSAGKGGGFDDSRHLWPTWFRLIRECRPDTIFGEQVSSRAGLAWFDHVAADLEAEGYAVGALDACAAGVGAPHIRQRLYWVAYTGSGRIQRTRPAMDRASGGAAEAKDQRQRLRSDVRDGGDVDGLADTDHAERGPFNLAREDGRDGQDGGREEAHGEPGARGQVRSLAHPDGRHPSDGDVQRSGEHGQQPQDGGAPGRLADAGGHESRRVSGLEWDRSSAPGDGGANGWFVGNADRSGCAARDREPLRAEQRPEQPAGTGPHRRGLGDPTSGGLRADGSAPRDTGHANEPDQARGMGHAEHRGREGRRPEGAGSGPALPSSPWSDAIWLPCRDGKARPIPAEPSLFPLAHGLPNRVGTLRGAGNAISPVQAAAFVRAFMETESIDG